MSEKIERPYNLDDWAEDDNANQFTQLVLFARWAKQVEAEKAELTEERRQNTSAMQAGLEAIEQLEAEKAGLEARIERAVPLIQDFGDFGNTDRIDLALSILFHLTGEERSAKENQLRSAKEKQLETRIVNAMKHHTRKRPVGFYEDWCDECDVLWKCPTVAGLEGED